MDILTSSEPRISPKGYRNIALALVGIALMFLVPTIISNPYYIRIGVTMCYMSMLVMGLRLMMTAGEFNLAIPAFMAIGAYTTAVLMTDMHWNWWLCMAVAGGIAMVIALVAGRIVLRVKGIYFAILGFALVQIMRNVWLNWPGVFGGTSGIANIPKVDGLSGSIVSYFYLGAGLALFTVVVMYLLEKSRYGLTLRAMGQAGNLAESVGVNVMRYKLSAFMVGALFAGIAGAFFASLQRFIDPEEFGFFLVLYLVVYSVVGGVRSFLGPIIGVVALLALPIGLKDIPGYDPKIEPIIFGGFLVVVMLFLPLGFVSLPERVWSLLRWFRRGRREEVGEYGTT
ncbi:branched-chain amino acid ABC transporter permease [Chloroflexota bacterium]